MADNMESLLMQGNDSSSDDSDGETVEEVSAGVVATTTAANNVVAPTSTPAPAPKPGPSISQGDLSSRLKSLYASSSTGGTPTSAQRTVAAPLPAQSQQPQQQQQQQQRPQQQQQPQPQSQPARPVSTPIRSGLPQGVPQPKIASNSNHHGHAPSSSVSSGTIPVPLRPNTSGIGAPVAAAIPGRVPQGTRASDPFEPTSLTRIIQNQSSRSSQSANTTNHNTALHPTPLNSISGSQHHPRSQPATGISSTTSLPISSSGHSSRSGHTPSSSTVGTSSASPHSNANSRTQHANSMSNKLGVPTVMTGHVSSSASNDKAIHDAKKRKEKFLMFTRVLMKYLEQKDREMHARAKAVIRECAEKNKKMEKGYESVTVSMQTRLRETVGELYWKKAEDYLSHFLQQKLSRMAREKAASLPSTKQSSVAANTSAATAGQLPQHQTTQSQREREKREREKREREKQEAINKIAALEKQKALDKQAKDQQKEEQAKKRKQQAAAAKAKQSQAQAKLAQQQRDSSTKKASLTAAIPSTKQAGATGTEAVRREILKKDKKKSSSVASSAPASASATAAGTVTKVEPPPREYSELMEMVDHAVNYDWTSAGLLLGKEHKLDVNLDEEQRKLLYGPKAAPRDFHELRQQTGWSKTNILSSRAAWAKIRLPEQVKQPHAPNISTATDWLNEEKAEGDKVLQVLSEATEIYIKSLLEGAVRSAQQRMNVDGIRLWHQQHGPSKPKLSLRLGCDVRRQVALAAGNSAKIVQRMEEALSRQKVPHESTQLNDKETLYHATSMSDLAKRPKLDTAASKADYSAKRSFETFGGKGASDPPLGRVPKKAKILAEDLRNVDRNQLLQRRRLLA